MRVVIWILLAVVVVATVKALRYFYALCGVLHYLIEKYNDELDDKSIKKLTIEAMRNIQW